MPDEPVLQRYGLIKLTLLNYYNLTNPGIFSAGIRLDQEYLITYVITAEISNCIAIRVGKISICYFTYLVTSVAFYYICRAGTVIYTDNNADMVCYGSTIVSINDNDVANSKPIGTIS